MKTLLFLIPFICFSQLRFDSMEHITAGMIISGTGYHITYKLTGRKFISRLSGILLSMGAGYAKEYIYDASGRGYISNSDMYYTWLGGAVIQIPIGRKKVKGYD